MRVDFWEKKLLEYLEQSRSLKFEWGVNDCVMWAGKWLDIARGTNQIEQYIGTYDSAESSQVILEELGCSDVSELATSRLLRKSVKMANRGDLVMQPVTNSLGICFGRLSYFMGYNGLVPTETLKCARAWGV
jgi:hypothetical protein